MAYKFRNLPCTITEENKIWCVVGSYENGYGILEWCYDKNDAEIILEKMLEYKDSRLSGMKIQKWSECFNQEKIYGNFYD